MHPDEDGYKIVKVGRTPRLLAVVKNQSSSPVYEARDNALLYAASPDLLEALIKIAGIAHGNGNIGEVIARRARVAIRKATGQKAGK